MTTATSSNVTAARQMLREKQADPGQLLELAKRLAREQTFGYARRLMAFAAAQLDARTPDAVRREVAQKHALYTYKDPDLPAATRLDRAVEILAASQDLRTTTDQETLGIAGAIAKRQWELDGRPERLERSLAYYHRGYEQGVTTDLGYTAINAAFVLDLLAEGEDREARRTGGVSPNAAGRREWAAHIRTRIVTELTPLGEGPEGAGLDANWWFLVTIAEAFFGLGRYDEARPWLDRARRVPNVAPWEFESTARQLAALARIQTGAAGVEDAATEALAWNALFAFLGDRAAAVETAFFGKVGVALSGGGFRASLFHIGVLAYLAERDVLRAVEALSCVSGGSIVGAHYYLEVRQLLRTKGDADITRDDYIALVRRLARDFLAGVQANVRTEVLADIWTNLKMLFLPDYSRTLRLGDLIERRIYSRVRDGEGASPRWLTQLFITPKGEADPFQPKHENWRRRNKVPVLVLNATTLNTGHNWQFTASWMGEPPAGIDAEIDGNYRLRRMYYGEAPPRHQQVRLGHAVAASACVPGLFEPLVLKGLYPGKTVRLVDGGVYDNQGVSGLLDQGCTVLLVSDAAGQMETEDDPSAGLLGVPLRAASVLMARARQVQYRELEALRRSSLVRGLMFLHLKKDLEAAPVAWATCDDLELAWDDARPAQHRGEDTTYGMRRDTQRRLAAIRTDLDSFCEAEAYALMLSGYRMARQNFTAAVEGWRDPPPGRVDWPFLAVAAPLDRGPGEDRLTRLLEVAKYPALKIWRLVPALRILGLVLLVVGAAGVGYAVWNWRTVSLPTVGSVAKTVAIVAASMLLGGAIVRLLWFRRTLGQVGIVTAASLGISLIAKLHLWVFDRLYKRWGELKRLVRVSEGGDVRDRRQ